MKGLYQHNQSQFYWFRFRVNGKEYRRSTGETDEAKAIEAARKFLETPPVVEASDLDSEIEKLVAGRSDNYKRNTLPVLKKFARAMEGVAVREITTAKIQAWIDGLVVKPNTKEAYRFQVETLFAALIKAGKARVNPAVEVKVNVEERSTRKNWIHKRQWAGLFELCTSLELKFALYAGFHAGLRYEEIIMFRPEWIDRDTGEFGVINVVREPGVWHPKDKDERTIPLSPEFRDFLDNGFPRLPGRYMIAPFKVKQPGERYRVEFRTAFETFVKKAGIGHFTRHDMRRSFASNLVSVGVSIYKVAKWLGDDVDVVQKTYGHLDPADDELASAFGPGPSNGSVIKFRSPEARSA